MAARADVSRSEARAWHLLGRASQNDGCRCRFLKLQTHTPHLHSLPVGLSHGAAAASHACPAIHTPPRRCSPPLICSVHRCTRAGAPRSGCVREAAGCASRRSHMAGRGGGAALWTARCAVRWPVRARAHLSTVGACARSSARTERAIGSAWSGAARVHWRRYRRRSPPPRVAAAGRCNGDGCV